MCTVGRQHKKSILFCNCEKDAVTLIKLQLCPGSVSRPLVAFHFKLMMLAEWFLLECHVSLLPKWVYYIYIPIIINNFEHSVEVHRSLVQIFLLSSVTLFTVGSESLQSPEQ